MKRSTRNKLQGKAKEVKGSVKKGVGELTGSPALKVEGQLEKVAGQFQQKLGRAESALGK